MSSEESGPPPVEGPQGSGEMAIEKGPFGGEWDRRSLFKGAALGTAAAAMYAGGRMAFGPLTAFADNLSGLKCTANDVRIPAPGQILNEPCTCSGTFHAQVSFPIVNNTGTSRYCVTMHLCAGVDEDGNDVVPAQDIIVGTIPPNFDGTKTVTIPNYPCGSGLVCFGATGPEADGGFPKGAACPAGQCCTTVSWNVVANDPCPDPGGVIKSKCRHQRICIQGRGETTIACPNNNCAVACGSSVGLTVCTTEPSSEGPFIFELRSGSTLVERFPTTGTTTATCHTFTVSPTADTTYFGRVISTQDDPDCVKDSPDGARHRRGHHAGDRGRRWRRVQHRRAHPDGDAGGVRELRLVPRRRHDGVLDGQPGELPGEPRQPVPYGARRRRLRRLPRQRVEDDQAVRDHDQPVPVAV